MILKRKYTNFFRLAFLLVLISCGKSDDVNFQIPEVELSDHPNDVYIREHMLNEYGTAVRWRWDDRYLAKGQSADAINEDLVIPVTKLIEKYWIEPFINLSNDSESFIRKMIPKEIVYLGSYIYNENGTRISGYSEGGSRVSLMNLNAYDEADRAWMVERLMTMHHEFTHIVRQNYGMPTGYNKVSPQGYLGAGWSNGVSLVDAIKRGMVSAYATRDQYEDFAELIAHYLVQDSLSFNSDYLEDIDCSQFSYSLDCYEINEGKALIRQKLKLVKEFYQDKFHINLEQLRDSIQIQIPD